MVRKIKVVYIASLGHSGSTLLDKILGSYKNNFSVGELNFWDFYINTENHNGDKIYHDFKTCSCGSKVINCEFWKKILKKRKYLVNTRELKNERRSILGFFLFPWKKIENISISNNDYFFLLKDIYYENLKFNKNFNYIVDSSKFRNKLVQLIQDKKIDLKIIFLIRDGRGVSYSYEKNENKNFIWANLYWIWTNLILYKIVKKSKRKFIIFNYDNFAKNPNKNIQKLENFLNLDLSNYVRNINKTVYHNIAGNNMRFKKFKGIKYDQKWKREFPLFKKIIVNIISFIPNKYFNYLDKKNDKK